MTRRKRVGANVTFDPAVAPNHFDGLRVSPRPYCSVAFKAAVERAATTSGGKITVTCLNCINCPWPTLLRIVAKKMRPRKRTEAFKRHLF